LSRVSVVILLVAVPAGLYGYSWLDREVLSTLPQDLSAYREWRPPTSCEVYGADGQLLDSFAVERRYWVDIDDLPDHVWQAFVAAEDSRFFEHPGVDLFGIARAAVANFRSGKKVQGGSTISQQLAKNLIVGGERSYERKLREAVLARRLDRELGKRNTLQLYLNYVFLGSGNYGVEAAARDYFGVSAAELDPGQAATIAGLVPAPSRYSPRRDAELARWRRAYVIRRMVEEGYLTAAAAVDYMDAPVLRPSEAGVAQGAGDETAYITEVRREVRRVVGPDVAFSAGLSVHTPYDAKVQAVAMAAVHDAVQAHLVRQGPRALGDVLAPDETADWEVAAEGLSRDADGAVVPPKEGDCFQALIPKDRDFERLRAGGMTFSLARADRDAIVSVPSLDRPISLRSAAKPRQLVRVCRAAAGVALERKPWAQAVAVVVEHATGRVIALVPGATPMNLEGFDRATQAKRQPGSSFKPYVYATALARGHSQLDLVLDGPLALTGSNGEAWSPQNYGGSFAGLLPMRRAIAQSLNTVSVRLALEAGPAEVARMARAMGVRTPLRQDLTIALGSSEVTPLDQAMGYTTIARLGVPVQPVYIDRVFDVNDRLVGVAGQPVVLHGKTAGELPGAPGAPVLGPGEAYELVDMLREVVRAGTARRAYVEGLERGGKTGTTNDYVDAWFVGFTATHTIAVWVGTDGVTTLGFGETGGRAALPAWVRIADALPKVPGQRLPMPEQTVMVKQDGVWVALARGHASALGAGAAPKAAPLPRLADSALPPG